MAKHCNTPVLPALIVLSSFLIQFWFVLALLHKCLQTEELKTKLGIINSSNKDGLNI
jgi:hypothetical protein